MPLSNVSPSALHTISFPTANNFPPSALSHNLHPFLRLRLKRLCPPWSIYLRPLASLASTDAHRRQGSVTDIPLSQLPVTRPLSLNLENCSSIFVEDYHSPARNNLPGATYPCLPPTAPQCLKNDSSYWIGLCPGCFATLNECLRTLGGHS